MITANGCTVTLKDSAGNGTISSTGIIGRATNGGGFKIEGGNYATSGSQYSFWAGGQNDPGHLEIENGTFTAAEGVAAAGKDSTIVVHDGVFSAGDNAVLASNGSAGYEGAQITVNGGQFEGHIKSSGYTGCDIYFPNDGVLTINGGTFEADGVCIAARAGKVYIKGGQFISTVDTEGWVGDRKTKLSANGVYYDGQATYPGLQEGAELKITGGTFTNTADAAIPAAKITQSATGAQITVDTGDWTVAE